MTITLCNCTFWWLGKYRRESLDLCHGYAGIWLPIPTIELLDYKIIYLPADPRLPIREPINSSTDERTLAIVAACDLPRNFCNTCNLTEFLWSDFQMGPVPGCLCIEINIVELGDTTCTRPMYAKIGTCVNKRPPVSICVCVWGKRSSSTRYMWN